MIVKKPTDRTELTKVINSIKEHIPVILELYNTRYTIYFEDITRCICGFLPGCIYNVSVLYIWVIRYRAYWMKRRPF